MSQASITRVWCPWGCPSAPLTVPRTVKRTCGPWATCFLTWIRKWSAVWWRRSRGTRTLPLILCCRWPRRSDCAGNAHTRGHWNHSPTIELCFFFLLPVHQVRNKHTSLDVMFQLLRSLMALSSPMKIIMFWFHSCFCGFFWFFGLFFFYIVWLQPLVSTQSSLSQIVNIFNVLYYILKINEMRLEQV